MAKGPGVGFYGKVRIPTIGHRKAIEQAKGVAKQVGGKLTVGLSGTSEPLTPALKKAHAEKLFNHPVMSGNEHTKTLSHFLSHMSSKHDELHLVAGSDRAGEYKNFLSKYNGKADRAGKVPFNFKKWTVHEVQGERQESSKDPRKMSQDELERSVSASKLEKIAKEGKYDHFKAYHPGMPEGHVRKLFTQIRKGSNLTEEMTRKELAPMLDSFVSFASDKLGLKSMPSIRYKTDDDEYNSFAAYSPADNELSIYTKDRHPMDVFRSVAHELVHHKQNEDGRLKNPSEEGQTGSPIENEANAEAGKIMRWFAKTNPDYFKLGSIVEETLQEGVNDPGIFKAVFLAGGPGSGKDYVLKNSLSGHGLVEINSDVAFEFLMKKEGLDFRMPEEQRLVRDLVRGRAKNVTKEQQRLALAGRLGLIINGTADDLAKTEKIRKDLENMGYETMMVFVNASDEISKQRNVMRGQQGGRMVPEMIRAEKWRFAQENMLHLRQLFGGNRFRVIDNSYDITSAPETKRFMQSMLTNVFKEVKAFVNSRPDNAVALKWIEDHKSKSKIFEDLRKWFGKGGEGGVGGGGWDRYNSKGERLGKCAREPGEGKPKCLSKEKAASLRASGGKKAIASVVRAKKRVDPVADRAGKGGAPVFSRAVANKLQKETVMSYLEEKNVPTNPELWSRAKSMARSKFDVYPSAYANGWASKWYKSKGGGWKSVSEAAIDEACWDGYKREGMKKKGDRMVPNCVPVSEDQAKVPMSKKGKVKQKLANVKDVDEAFNSFMEENTPAQREWGTTSLADIYKKGTPGQSSEKKKKLKKEDNNLPRQGLPVADGIGPETTQYRPMVGYGYSMPMEESIINWMNRPSTQAKFAEKYGELAEQKLIEAAMRLQESGCGFESSAPKSIKKLKEGLGLGYNDMGTVATQRKDEVREETPAWQRKEGQSQEGGLNRKGIASYRRANPGSKLSMAVTTKPSKLKKGSKAANRRKSFCARMGGMKKRLTSSKTANDPNSRINKALRKWNCEE